MGSVRVGGVGREGGRGGECVSREGGECVVCG